MERKLEAIKLHLLKAYQLLEDVDVLLENTRYTSIISRLYYACFHAASALLLSKELTSKTHKGLQVLLQKHFVVEGVLDFSQAKFFARLFEERMEDDYGDFYISNKEDVINYINPAKDFISNIDNILRDYVSN